MLATLLKSPTATQTTLLIIDTFAKARELGRMISKINELPENAPKQKTLMARTGDFITDLIIPQDELDVIGTEITVEMNFAIFKVKMVIIVCWIQRFLISSGSIRHFNLLRYRLIQCQKFLLTLDRL